MEGVLDELVHWLAPLGLEQLAPLLQSNDIDLAILPELTEADLEKLGLSLGHRKKLLKAIANLPDSSSSTSHPPLPTAEPSAASSAERRQLTVLFCDLVGSTALASQLDPEDLREMIGAYQRCVAKTVGRFAGFVAKYMGDGALIYFGYPRAHEDDPERAVRAALKLANAIGQLRTSPPLQVRIGIETGLVVVGDLVGSGEAQERGVVGGAVNLASRLQALAEPNAVVIGPTTQRLIGGLFEYRDLGTLKVKGFAEPLRPFQVLRKSEFQSRFEALHAADMTPLFGREEELELLTRRWDRAKSGDGQVVLLSAEPGIGKSRITAAAQDRISSEPHTCLRYFCSPRLTNSALYPTIAQLERAAGFGRDDEPEAKLDKLKTLLAPASPPAQDIALLADLLSLPGRDIFPSFSLTPQQKKKETFEALLRQLEGLAKARPVLMIFEDVHWIDPTSRELLQLVVEMTPRLRLLLLITFRPEFQSPWTGLPHVTTLTLTRLPHHAGLLMVEQIAGRVTLSRDLLDEIVARTDGVPLFIEELTKAVLEAGSGQDGATPSRTPSATLAVPATLHASLMARLDRLGPTAMEVAQVAAALGREFSYELLVAVAGPADEKTERAIAGLVNAGLVFQRGTLPEAHFQFKHALVQDAAYGTLLRGKRQELHARIVGALEARFPQLLESQPEVLAHHLTAAGLSERAVEFWRRAGERAAKSSANLEAVAHLGRGLELLQAVPNRAAHADQELRLLIAMGPALMTTRSTADPEIERTYSRARVLARETDRSAELFPIIWGSCLVAFISGEIQTAIRLARELFELVRGEIDPGLLLQAHHASWSAIMATGDLLGARQHLQSGLALYDREKHSQHAHLYGGHDPGVCGYTNNALCLVMLGHPDQALQQIERAIELAHQIDHPPSLAQALWFGAEVRYLRREPTAVEELISTVLPLIAKHGSIVGVANATMLHGWALTALGSVEVGIAEVRKGLDAWRGTGSKFHAPYRLARAADAFRLAGLSEQGLNLVAEAMAVMEHTGDRWFEPELHRLKGELLGLADGNQSEAAMCFGQAVELARVESARLVELRAAKSLARLWHDDGKLTEARELLAPILGWFTEGLGTPDIKEAKVTLAELS
jgi:class 3 adenylate cyclase/predicted ATPase